MIAARWDDTIQEFVAVDSRGVEHFAADPMTADSKAREADIHAHRHAERNMPARCGTGVCAECAMTAAECADFCEYLMSEKMPVMGDVSNRRAMEVAGGYSYREGGL